ncbi:hypothetical protein GN956_G4578 [Arapaima gigas]
MYSDCELRLLLSLVSGSSGREDCGQKKKLEVNTPSNSGRGTLTHQSTRTQELPSSAPPFTGPAGQANS